MAYTKTTWIDRLVEKPNTFTVAENGDGTLNITQSPGTVFASGTPISADNLNKIEDALETLDNEKYKKPSNGIPKTDLNNTTQQEITNGNAAKTTVDAHVLADNPNAHSISNITNLEIELGKKFDKEGGNINGDVLLTKSGSQISFKTNNGNKIANILFNANDTTSYGLIFGIDGLQALQVLNQKSVKFVDYEGNWSSLQDLKQSVSNGKALNASAITDMGVPTASNATFEQMATNIRQIFSGRRSKQGTAYGQGNGNVTINDVPFSPSFVVIKDATQGIASSYGLGACLYVPSFGINFRVDATSSLYPANTHYDANGKFVRTNVLAADTRAYNYLIIE